MSPRRAPAPPIRVLIVDDSSRQREGWALLLGSQPQFEVVGQASDGAGVRGSAPECCPVTIMPGCTSDPIKRSRFPIISCTGGGSIYLSLSG